MKLTEYILREMIRDELGKLTEAVNVDKMNIFQKLVKYKRNIIKFEDLYDGIVIDLTIQSDRRKMDELEDHLAIISDDIKHGNKKDLMDVTKELLRKF